MFCLVWLPEVLFAKTITCIISIGKVRGISLLDKVKSTDIRQSLNIEPLLLRIERSQLPWYGHVTRMSHEQTAKQLMDALPNGKKI